MDSTDKKIYRFNGWQNPSVRPVNDAFCEIRDQHHLYDLLEQAWCRKTCAPRMQQEWCNENKTRGQCSITAFLVQDIFGGEVYGIPFPDGNFHCYNVIGKVWFDLTSEQFGGRAEGFVYENNPVQLREKHFANKEKEERYQLLKNRLTKALNRN
ncbi:MAG: hypothetical protein HUJ54_05720 [Erysipelotrichaceae bacterium]|nr:hypothetical protein [Erysipelotrichaceae bacterium]